MKKSAGKAKKRVVFQISAAPGSEVFLAGTFNNWDPRQRPLRGNPAEGIYRTTLMLPSGRHEYKFVVDGEWRMDPNCAQQAPNAHGSMNSVIEV
jgi:1,4-alpha-glucan branching enzyme